MSTHYQEEENNNLRTVVFTPPAPSIDLTTLTREQLDLLRKSSQTLSEVGKCNYVLSVLNLWREENHAQEVLTQYITDDFIRSFIDVLRTDNTSIDSIVNSLTTSEDAIRQEDSLFYRLIHMAIEHDEALFSAIIQAFAHSYSDKDMLAEDYPILIKRIAPHGLLRCAMYRRNNIAKFILNTLADLDPTKHLLAIMLTANSNSAFWMAVNRNNTDLVDLFIAHASSIRDRKETVKHLLSANNGRPLIAAAKKGHTEIVASLIAAAQNIDNEQHEFLIKLLTFDNAAALSYAVTYHHINTVKMILEPAKRIAPHSIELLILLSRAFFTGLNNIRHWGLATFNLLNDVIINSRNIFLFEYAIVLGELDVVKLILDAAKCQGNNNASLIYLLTTGHFAAVKHAALTLHIEILAELLSSMKDISENGYLFFALTAALDMDFFIDLLLKNNMDVLSALYPFMVKDSFHKFTAEAIEAVKKSDQLDNKDQAILHIIKLFVAHDNQPLSREKIIQTLDFMDKLSDNSKQYTVIDYLLQQYIDETIAELYSLSNNPSLCFPYMTLCQCRTMRNKINRAQRVMRGDDNVTSGGRLALIIEASKAMEGNNPNREQIQQVEGPLPEYVF